MAALVFALLALSTRVCSAGTLSAYFPPGLGLATDGRPGSEGKISRGLSQAEVESPKKKAFLGALYRRDVDGVREAVEGGLDVDTKVQGDYAALHLATYNGDERMVILLLQLGADPNVRGAGGTTSLHIAAKLGDVRVTEILLVNRANATWADSRGFTALHFAAYGDISQKYVREDLAFVDGSIGVKQRVSGDRLIAPADSLLAQFKNHKIPNHMVVIEMLLGDGADVNARTNIGETPLHYVSSFDRYQAAQLLVKAGADVGIPDVQRETALHEAVAYGALGVTEVLLMAGADTYAEEQNGLNPRQFICRCVTYHGDSSLTPCGPGLCMTSFDRLVLESMIDMARGKG